jgi:hypothetical protein
MTDLSQARNEGAMEVLTENQILKILQSYLVDSEFQDHEDDLRNPTREYPNARVELAIEHIEALYPDHFTALFRQYLRAIIINYLSYQGDINMASLKELMKSYPDIINFKSSMISGKEFLFLVEVFVKAAVVYYLSLREIKIFEMIHTPEELMEDYPSFSAAVLSADELQYLIRYCNMMKLAVEVIPAKGNKRLMMTICSLLEGSGKVYTTGSTQSSSTSRRVLIYEQESGLQPTRRTTPRHVLSRRAEDFFSCPCGAVILLRTVQSHQKSKRHVAYLLSKKRKEEVLGIEA